MKKTVLLIAITLLYLISSAARAEESSILINGPEVKTGNDNISVSFSIDVSASYKKSIRSELKKEFNVFVDLFRSWNIWPDEFIAGKKYVRTLSVDPIKKEYIGSSFDGETFVYKRFKSFESMLKWVLDFKDAFKKSFKGLNPGSYYVKITIESKKTGIPSLITDIFFLLPVHEIKIEKKSSLLYWDGKKLRTK